MSEQTDIGVDDNFHWLLAALAAKIRAGWRCSVCQAEQPTDRSWLLIAYPRDGSRANADKENVVVVCPRCLPPTPPLRRNVYLRPKAAKTHAPEAYLDK